MHLSVTCHFWSYSLFSSVSVNSTLVAELRSIALADLFFPIQSLLKGPLLQLVSAGSIRVLSAQALRDVLGAEQPSRWKASHSRSFLFLDLRYLLIILPLPLFCFLSFAEFSSSLSL